MKKLAQRLAFFLVSASAVAAGVGCSSGADEPYKPQPAWSGKKASLPAPPTIPSTPLKSGDAYTVYGATHQLRSELHNVDVTKDAIAITGYIVKTNYADAPACSIHPAGKKDPDNCDAPIPSFWIADSKGDTSGPMIRVIGWARNFAIIYDAMKAYDKLKPGDSPKEPINDDILNVPIPFPLPAVGAKVKITGKYAVSGRNSGDLVSDPINGVMSQQKIEFVEPSPDKAQFAQKI